MKPQLAVVGRTLHGAWELLAVCESTDEALDIAQHPLAEKLETILAVPAFVVRASPLIISEPD